MSQTMTRTFLLVGTDGRNLDVEAKLERLSGNRLAHFSITSQHGTGHDEIRKAAESIPADVRADLETLINVHLVDASATPVHAVANGAFHMAQGDFAAALRSLANAGTLEDLYQVHGRASTRHVVEFPGVAERLKKEAQDFVALRTEAQEFLASAKKDGSWMRQKRAENRIEALALELEKNRTLRKFVNAIRRDNSDLIEEARKSHASAILNEELGLYAEKVCRPLWIAAADNARLALAKPDWRDERRPEIAQDRSTFEGFANVERLSLLTAPTTRSDPAFEGMRHYACTVSGPNGSFELVFSQGSAHRGAPTLETILETLQSDFGAVETMGEEEYIETYFSDGGIQALRRGEAAYRQVGEQIRDFNAMVGEEAYAFFVSSVGDNPPLPDRAEAGPRP